MYVPCLNYQNPSSNFLTRKIVADHSGKIFVKVDPPHNVHNLKVVGGLRIIIILLLQWFYIFLTIFYLEFYRMSLLFASGNLFLLAWKSNSRSRGMLDYFHIHGPKRKEMCFQKDGLQDL